MAMAKNNEELRLVRNKLMDLLAADFDWGRTEKGTSYWVEVWNAVKDLKYVRDHGTPRYSPEEGEEICFFDFDDMKVYGTFIGFTPSGEAVVKVKQSETKTVVRCIEGSVYPA